MSEYSLVASPPSNTSPISSASSSSSKKSEILLKARDTIRMLQSHLQTSHSGISGTTIGGDISFSAFKDTSMRTLDEISEKLSTSSMESTSSPRGADLIKEYESKVLEMNKSYEKQMKSVTTLNKNLKHEISSVAFENENLRKQISELEKYKELYKEKEMEIKRLSTSFKKKEKNEIELNQRLLKKEEELKQFEKMNELLRKKDVEISQLSSQLKRKEKNEAELKEMLTKKDQELKQVENILKDKEEVIKKREIVEEELKNKQHLEKELLADRLKETSEFEAYKLKKQDFEKTLLQKLKKRVSELKSVSIDGISLASSTTLQQSSSKRPCKKVTNQIGETLRELKILVRDVVKRMKHVTTEEGATISIEKDRMNHLLEIETHYIELTSQLRGMMGVKENSEIIPQCQVMVEQFRKYVEVFPKFQRLIKELCSSFNVEEIEDLIPAVRKLVLFGQSVDQWIRDNHNA